jgi:hypothetical protein
MRRVALLITIGLLISACAEGSDAGSDADYTGLIYIDAQGSRLCEALAESYPPQCGGVIVELADLRPDLVVALQSPTDPSLAPVSWTDYNAGVAGDESDGVLSNVELTDPVATGSSDGLIERVADLGIRIGEPIVIPIDVRNTTDEDMTLTFPTGQRVEFTLSSDSGEIYRWSNDMFFTQAIEVIELPAGAIYGATLVIEPTTVPSSIYNEDEGTLVAKAWITATEIQNVVVEWETSIG